MADILIKNMEMPKYCRSCPFEESSIYGQQCRITRKFTRLNDNEDGMKRHISCPLVALPEHGRLGDIDKAFADNESILDCEIDHPRYQDTVREILDSIPIILEASNE